MTKHELRILYKQKRLAIPAAQKDKLEDLLLIQFQRLNIDLPAMIMTYAPFEKFNEFDPQLITDYCYFKNNEQVLFYPVIEPVSNKMEAVGVDDDTLFTLNKYGLAEPENGVAIPASEIDLVIVPLLAFDKKGNRVGYGKGYYDRFLKTCREDVVKIGCSFFEAEDTIDDMNEFDVKLDYCITPDNIYEFKKN